MFAKTAILDLTFGTQARSLFCGLAANLKIAYIEIMPTADVTAGVDVTYIGLGKSSLVEIFGNHTPTPEEIAESFNKVMLTFRRTRQGQLLTPTESIGEMFKWAKTNEWRNGASDVDQKRTRALFSLYGEFINDAAAMIRMPDKSPEFQEAGSRCSQTLSGIFMAALKYDESHPYFQTAQFIVDFAHSVRATNENFGKYMVDMLASAQAQTAIMTVLRTEYPGRFLVPTLSELKVWDIDGGTDGVLATEQHIMLINAKSRKLLAGQEINQHPIIEKTIATSATSKFAERQILDVVTAYYYLNPDTPSTHINLYMPTHPKYISPLGQIVDENVRFDTLSGIREVLKYANTSRRP